MMSCETFRISFRAGSDDAAALAHLRSCDRCLDFAVSADPDVLFRSLGGDDVVPPGGVDAFVDDVMRQVRVRGAENTMRAPKVISWPRRLAAAATLAAAVAGTTFIMNYDTAAPPAGIAHRLSKPAAQQVALVSKPIVESYESENATIVEVPTEANDDVKIVMIFDENLPADL